MRYRTVLKVGVQAADECWKWTGKRSRDRYGIFRVNRRDFAAHRLAYELTTGRRAEVVMHTCDVRCCCNPRHLRGGTQRENIEDRQRKQRQAKGSKNGRAKLNETEALLIRSFAASGNFAQATLAREFEVDRTVVRDILAEKTWRNLPTPRELLNSHDLDEPEPSEVGMAGF